MADLLSTNFPIYSVDSFGDKLFYVAGGGGKAKTGIPNTIEVFKLNSNGGYSAVSLCKHDMGEDLIMQSEVLDEKQLLLGASVGRECQIFSVNCSIDNRIEELGKIDDEKDSVAVANTSTIEKEKLSQKSESEKEDIPNSSHDPAVDNSCYSISKVACVITDEAEKDSCQNVVRFVKKSNRVLTAGEDGKIRVWSLPVLKPKETMVGHQNEVNNIVLHPQKEMCVSISRDGTCRVWDLQCYNELHSFKWTKHGEYRFRSCCFSEDGDNLFTINIPLKLSSRKRKRSFLMKWNTTAWKELNCVSLHTSIPTTVASKDSYVAVGNVNGDVTVFTTDLKPISKTISLHTSFVTGLCFVQSADTKEMSPPPPPPVLLSTSVDKRCCITVVKQAENKWSKVHLIILASVFFILVAIITDYFLI